jgi:hypothetical protein
MHRYLDYEKSPAVLREFIDREQFIRHDVFEYDLFLLIQEFSKEDVAFILSNIVENCRDKKKRLLWDLQKEAVLCIPDKDNLNPFRIMVRLSSRVNIKNDAVSCACLEYWKDPASHALDHIANMSATPQPVIKRIIKIPVSYHESLRRIFNRVMDLIKSARRRGLHTLQGEIDPDKMAMHEVLDYGIFLLSAEFPEEELDMILDNMIGSEKNPVKRHLKRIQKEAIFCISRGDYFFLTANTLLAMSGLKEREIAKMNEHSLY